MSVLGRMFCARAARIVGNECIYPKAAALAVAEHTAAVGHLYLFQACVAAEQAGWRNAPGRAPAPEPPFQEAA